MDDGTRRTVMTRRGPTGATTTTRHDAAAKGKSPSGRAKGEGSRGGKVVGHTSTGKPIYESHSHPSHADFTKDEHREAGRLHDKLAKSVDSLHEANQHRLQAGKHRFIAASKTKHTGPGVDPTGGRVIGKTRSGKDVFEDHHSSHNKFEPQEHYEAAGLHVKAVDRLVKNIAEGGHNPEVEDELARHQKRVTGHLGQAKRKRG